MVSKVGDARFDPDWDRTRELQDCSLALYPLSYHIPIELPHPQDSPQNDPDQDSPQNDPDQDSPQNATDQGSPYKESGSRFA